MSNFALLEIKMSIFSEKVMRVHQTIDQDLEKDHLIFVYNDFNDRRFMLND